jgi:hypothetical protein
MSEGRAWLAALAATWAAAMAPMLVVVGYGVYLSGFDAAGIPSFFGWSFVIWAIAVLHLVLAFPLYLLLDRWGWVNWGTAALAGALIGALPLPLLFQFPLEGSLVFAAFTGGAGLVGGLTFRAVLGKPV